MEIRLQYETKKAVVFHRIVTKTSNVTVRFLPVNCSVYSSLSLTKNVPTMIPLDAKAH